MNGLASGWALGGRRNWVWLVLIPVLLGGALRFYHAWSCYGVYLPHGDREEGYYEAGIALLSCGVLSNGVPDESPSAFKGPIFPSFIAMVETAFARPHPGHVRMAQALLATLEIAAVFALAAQLSCPLAGFAASLAMALNMDLILSVSRLDVHGFYASQILAVTVAVLSWMRGGASKATILLGFFLGGSLLCRSAHFPLPVFLAAASVLWWRFPQPWRRLALLAAAMALFLSPMALRNALHFKKFILLDSYKGSYILLRSTAGPYTNTTVEQAFDTAESLSPGFKARGLTSGPALHEAFLRLAMKNMLDHPWRYLGYCLQRLFAFWKGLWLPLLFGACALACFPGSREIQAVALVAASFCGYGVAGGTPEYRVSVWPVLYVLAGCGAAGLLSRVPSWRRLPLLRGGPQLWWSSWVLKAVLGTAAAVYAGMGLLLFREVSGLIFPRNASPLSCADGRALEVLRLAAVSAQSRGPGVIPYVHALLRNANQLQDIEDIPRARENLKKALSVISAHSIPRELFAGHSTVIADRSRPDLSRPDLSRPDRSRPDRSVRRPPLERAEILLRLKDYDGAEKEISRVLNRGLRCHEAVTALSLLRSYRGRPAQALQTLAGCGLSPRRLDPAVRSDWLMAHFVVKAGIEGRGGGEDDLREALALSPRRVCERTPLLVERSRLPVIYFDLCLERFPRQARLWLDRGITRYLAGEPRSAQEDLRQALKLDPGSLEAALSLAVVLQGSGLPTQALETIESGLKAAPSHRRAGKLYRQALSMRDSLRSGR